MSDQDVIDLAFNEFHELLFGEVPKDPSQHMVTRRDYKKAMKKVQQKYSLEQGHPRYLEWSLLLVARSPRFIDQTSQSRETACLLPKEWLPTYTNDLMSKLKHPEMLEICGKWVMGVLNSSLFWNRLKRRMDMMTFVVIQKELADTNDMRPREMDPVTADMLFSVLVEPEIQNAGKKYAKDWLVDELFRLIVQDQVVGLTEQDDANYTYFSAPYLSSNVYGNESRNGEIWLNDLTEDVFRMPLSELCGEIRGENLD